MLIPLAHPVELENPEYVDIGPLLRVGSLFPVNGLGFISAEQFISPNSVVSIPLVKEGSVVLEDPVVSDSLERKVVPWLLTTVWLSSTFDEVETKFAGNDESMAVSGPAVEF